MVKAWNLAKRKINGYKKNRYGATKKIQIKDGRHNVLGIQHQTLDEVFE